MAHVSTYLEICRTSGHPKIYSAIIPDGFKIDDVLRASDDADLAEKRNATEHVDRTHVVSVGGG